MVEAEQYLRKVLAPFGALTDEQWAHMTRHSVRQSPEGPYRMVYDPGIVAPMKAGPIQDLDLWPLWDKIRCPVLVLRGTQSDVLMADTAAEMQQRGPRTEVVEFEGVGHAPALMAPGGSVVRRWLLSESPA
jgi:pimeloyl-ACP methyl ester carboxylesterase